jgi:[NiFe] hydrogenase diaphorase moiety small subunit
MFTHKHALSTQEHKIDSQESQDIGLSLSIDGLTIPFKMGQTIIQAAMDAGIYIPHLCNNPEFNPHGSCRICTVSVNGRNAAACTMPAAPGQQVFNNTEKLQHLRHTLLQMLFVEGNHICPGCERSGACQLQAVAYYTGMLAPRFKHFFPHRELDASHPDMIIDRNRCILCELCVRASHQIDAKDVFSISGRGLNAHLVVNSPSGELGDSDFSITDKAADICPVGALLPRREGYRVPLGQRLYDCQPINVVGDVHAVKYPKKSSK